MSSEALEDTLTAAGVIALEADPRGHLLALSDSWEELTGWPREASLGTFLFEHLHSHDWAEHQRALHALLSGQRAALELAMRLLSPDPDSAPQWFQWRLRAELADDQTLTCVRAVLHTLEPEPDLGPGAREPTPQARMVGGLAHDFNNALQGILTANELIKERIPREDPDRECIEIIDELGGRLTELVEQLVAFARVGPRDPEPLELGPLLQGALRMSGALEAPHIHLHYEPPPQPLQLEGDHAQLLRVVVHLIQNALEAMGDEPCGDLEITARPMTLTPRLAPLLDSNLTPGEHAQINIRDTGPGIDPEAMPHIFEPFFTTRQGQRGLGLAAARGTITHHGGALRINSRPGRGTTASIYLPLREELELADHAVTTEMSVWNGMDRLVLLADDEHAVRRVMRRTLEAQRFRVLEARSAQHALALFEEHHDEISMCLLDHIMPPGPSGAALIHELRALSPSVPIIICTGYDMRHERSPSHDEPMLLKPFTQEQLLATVFRCLI